MTTQRSKETVRGFVDALVRGELDEWDQVLAPHYTEHNDNMPSDREALKRYFREVMGKAFPDATYHPEDLFAEGDKVAYRWSMQGTHTGEFLGIPPSGRRVSTSGIDIWRVEDGRMVEHWGAYDILGLMQQIGALPPQPERAR